MKPRLLSDLKNKDWNTHWRSHIPFLLGPLSVFSGCLFYLLSHEFSAKRGKNPNALHGVKLNKTIHQPKTQNFPKNISIWKCHVYIFLYAVGYCIFQKLPILIFKMIVIDCILKIFAILFPLGQSISADLFPVTEVWFSPHCPWAWSVDLFWPVEHELGMRCGKITSLWRQLCVPELQRKKDTLL